MTKEPITIVARLDTLPKPVCPHCGRIRGVRWRQRDKVYLCGLCGHAWRPETPPSTPETGVAEPVQPQTGESEAKHED